MSPRLTSPPADLPLSMREVVRATLTSSEIALSGGPQMTPPDPGPTEPPGWQIMYVSDTGVGGSVTYMIRTDRECQAQFKGSWPPKYSATSNLSAAGTLDHVLTASGFPLFTGILMEIQLIADEGPNLPYEVLAPNYVLNFNPS